MAGGIGGGLGFILLLDQLTPSIRLSLKLSARLCIQPFVTIPYVGHEMRIKCTLMLWR